jgi:hypothetical protein
MGGIVGRPSRQVSDVGILGYSREIGLRADPRRLSGMLCVSVIDLWGGHGKGEHVASVYLLCTIHVMRALKDDSTVDKTSLPPNPDHEIALYIYCHHERPTSKQQDCSRGPGKSPVCKCRLRSRVRGLGCRSIVGATRLNEIAGFTAWAESKEVLRTR